MRPPIDSDRIRTFARELGRALSKIERGFAHDLEDVRSMLRAGLVHASRLRELFAEIEPSLFRYPAIDREAFRRKVERFLESAPHG